MINRQLGQFQITAKLGAGGMGEVYRASDAKLGREVAIKVLPASLTQTQDAVTRFEREAKALASLNHPNIAAIYGFDCADGTHFLVMELIDGETLDLRLARGALPLNEGLEIARQIAEALEAAHARGIVHRDLKPANIKITPAGRVKVLDFGLAKAIGDGAALINSDLADSPTVLDAAHRTLPGLILGTAAYMSPEQARGQPIDQRTDVWAFGCCLYECLTGRKVFHGRTVTELIAEVLKSTPKWSGLPPETPAPVVALLRRCLEKDARRRLSSLHDISITLEETLELSRDSTRQIEFQPPMPQRDVPRAKSRWLVPIISSAVAGLLLSTAWLSRRLLPRTSVTEAVQSVAVLPFENLTSKPALEPICNGFADDVSMGLKRTGLFDKVPLWASVKRFQGSGAPTPEIAQQLGVATLVHGTIKRSGQELQVNADLLDGASGKPLWSDSFSITNGDIGVVQNGIVRQLIKHLRPALPAENQRRLAPARNIKMEAYAAFRNGIEQYDLFTRESFTRSQQYFEKARQLDPAFVDPLGMLATAKWLPVCIGLGSAGVTPEQAFRDARLLLSEASGEAKTHSSILRAQAWIAMAGDWNWKQALETFRASAAADPEEPVVNLALGYYFGVVEGRLTDASRETESALKSDPERLLFLDTSARHYEYHGRYAEALSVWQKIHSRYPENWSSLWDEARCLRELSHLKEARQAAERAVQLSGRNPLPLAELAVIDGHLGNTSSALAIRQELEKAAQDSYVPRIALANAHAATGDLEGALGWLERGVAEKDGWLFLSHLRTHAALRRFGEQPRYWALVDQINLPALPVEHPFYDLEQKMRFHKNGSDSLTLDHPARNETKSIAVLPFLNLSADKENEYFSDGMSEEILNALARTPGLQVAARTSSFFFKGKNESPQRIGAALNVKTILEGSVRRAGDRLRITAQLINVDDGFHLWSDTFDRQAADVFAIQSEVAQQVQQHLRLKLLGATNSILLGTDNLEAYDLYLRGRHFWNERTGITRAAELFKRATELDPRFAAAYAGLATSYVLMPGASLLSEQEATPKARVAAQRALELAPLPEAHAALSWCEPDPTTATRELLEALRLNPNYATGHQWYSFHLLSQGKKDQALEEIRLAQRLDPLSAIIQVALAGHYYLDGRYDEALVEIDKAFAISPGFPPAYQHRGRIRLLQQKIPEAIADYEEFRKLAGDTPDALAPLGYSYAKAGRTNDARKIIQALKPLADAGKPVAVGIGIIDWALGDFDEAFTWFERAAETQEKKPTELKSEPLLKGINEHPRYALLVKKFAAR